MREFSILYDVYCVRHLVPKIYIEFIRMCKAEDLLISTGLDLNYISQETGFSDCSHFIKALKQKNGVTPKQYRKQHRNQP
ncbi:helix-turn-helix domain-containing protein [Roseburia faecis]|uniref:helix-turn-helix domain-containing protein n=1 Tax=Roseburia faecis TaxID=301302 RepID=UPI003F95A80C